MLPACTWCGTLLSHRLYTQGEGRCPLHSPPPPQSMPTSGGSAAQEWQERFLVAERVANNVSPPEVAQVSAFENNLNVNL